MNRKKKSTRSVGGRKNRKALIPKNSKKLLHDKFFDLEPHINSLVWGCGVLVQFLAHGDDSNAQQADSVSWIADKIAEEAAALQAYYQHVMGQY